MVTSKFADPLPEKPHLVLFTNAPGNAKVDVVLNKLSAEDIKKEVHAVDIAIAAEHNLATAGIYLQRIISSAKEVSIVVSKYDPYAKLLAAHGIKFVELEKLNLEAPLLEQLDSEALKVSLSPKTDSRIIKQFLSLLAADFCSNKAFLLNAEAIIDQNVADVHNRKQTSPELQRQETKLTVSLSILIAGVTKGEKHIDKKLSRLLVDKTISEVENAIFEFPGIPSSTDGLTDQQKDEVEKRKKDFLSYFELPAISDEKNLEFRRKQDPKLDVLSETFFLKRQLFHKYMNILCLNKNQQYYISAVQSSPALSIDTKCEKSKFEISAGKIDGGKGTIFKIWFSCNILSNRELRLNQVKFDDYITIKTDGLLVYRFPEDATAFEFVDQAGSAEKVL